MSSTRTNFLEAILDDPDNDTLRLVFTDYLEENGEAVYAQFIRTQIELAKVPEYDPLWIRCWFDDRDAITGRHMDKERPILPEGVRWDSRAFRRGLPASIEVDQAETFVAHAPALFRLAPIEALKIRSAYRAPPPNIATLCDSPYFARIRELKFSLSRLPAVEIKRLQNSPHAVNLVDLTFEFAGIDSSGIAALFRPPLINRLKSLNLSQNSATNLPAAIQQADAPGQLRRLTFCESGGYWFERKFFNAPLLRHLVELNLSGYRLNADGFHGLCDAGFVASLESLILPKTEPGVPGIRALAECASLSGLRRLVLSNNRVGPVAIKHLAPSPAFANLRVLGLTNNPLGDKGAIALARSQSLSHLVQLDLMHCEIGDTGAEALLNSPVTSNLLHINLHGDSCKVRIGNAIKAQLRARFEKRVFV